MRFDVTIAGAGIVGLATALKIKEANPRLKVCLLEKEKDIAMHQTGRNSGVIHSGIYYKPGSLKAENCIRGYHMLLEFCSRHEIPFQLCGKVILATSIAGIPRIDMLLERGIQNGLTRIKKLTKSGIKEIEPYAAGVAGIWVPYTGIVDYRVVSQKIASLFRSEYSGEIATSERLEKILEEKGGLALETSSKIIHSRVLVNTTGVYSDRVARLSSSVPEVRIIPFRGEYYYIRPEKRNLVRNLIYPLPDPDFPFLGVHFTRRIDGTIEAGPNAVFAFKREGYSKSDFSVKDFLESVCWTGFQRVMFRHAKTGLAEFYRSYSKSAFTRALQKLVPDIRKDDLIAGNSGIRAQACSRNGILLDDFLIEETERIIHVLNAPSPAATASFSIGRFIAEKVIKKF
jgi:L-2-hydroxyglutarate oxidase